MPTELPQGLLRELFQRLTRGDNLFLSSNGPGSDAALFNRVCAHEETCRERLLELGYKLVQGDNHYCLVSLDESPAAADYKLERLVELVRQVSFLSRHIENFGEGTFFSQTQLAARIHADPGAERFLAAYKGESNADKLDDLLRGLERRGYIDEADAARREYKVLSAIHYLMGFIDRLQINEEEGEGDAAS